VFVCFAFTFRVGSKGREKGKKGNVPASNSKDTQSCRERQARAQKLFLNFLLFPKSAYLFQELQEYP
jgi:hypothetical protein